MSAASLASIRADSLDLIGPEFDCPSPEPARRTLIICSAQRTGSYELCRHLLAAGVGVPHEYFNGHFARRLAARWAIPGPLGETELPRYLDILRRFRAQGGVFATKLQFYQFDRRLRNQSGAALFDGACVVHLFRPDVVGQFASFRAALVSGIWDFSPRQTRPPRAPEREPSRFLEQALGDLNQLIGEDAGFRYLFVLLAIRPIFVTTDELFRDPRGVVRRIADAVASSVNEEALEQSIACSAPYGHDQARERAVAGLAESFRKLAFQKRT